MSVLYKLFLVLIFITSLSACAVKEPITKPEENLVFNGGFEDPKLLYGRWATFREIPGWKLLDGPGIEVQNHVAGSPYEGQQYVELDSDASSSIYQDIPTRIGHHYTLTVALAARPGTGPEDNIIDIVWNGKRIDLVQLYACHDTCWNIHTYQLTTEKTLSRLEFHDKGISNGLGSYIDDVVLKETR